MTLQLKKSDKKQLFRIFQKMQKKHFFNYGFKLLSVIKIVNSIKI